MLAWFLLGEGLKLHKFELIRGSQRLGPIAMSLAFDILFTLFILYRLNFFFSFFFFFVTVLSFCEGPGKHLPH